jgi:hypothetical protein
VRGGAEQLHGVTHTLCVVHSHMFTVTGSRAQGGPDAGPASVGADGDGGAFDGRGRAWHRQGRRDRGSSAAPAGARSGGQR